MGAYYNFDVHGRRDLLGALQAVLDQRLRHEPAYRLPTPRTLPWPEGEPFPRASVVPAADLARRYQDHYDDADSDGERDVLARAWFDLPGFTLWRRWGGVVDPPDAGLVVKGVRVFGYGTLRDARPHGYRGTRGVVDLGGQAYWADRAPGGSLYVEHAGKVYGVPALRVGKTVRTRRR